jgi:thiol-disulfide isomerase/thioredoxin
VKRLLMGVAAALGALLMMLLFLVGGAVWVASAQMNGQGLFACCRLPTQARTTTNQDLTLRYEDLRSGDIRTLDSLPTFVVFFASWCPSCAEEAPALKRLASEGAPVLLLSATDSHRQAQAWVERHAPTLPAGVLEEGSKIVNDLGIVSLPTILLLDETGREISRWKGRVGHETLREAWLTVNAQE